MSFAMDLADVVLNANAGFSLGVDTARSSNATHGGEASTGVLNMPSWAVVTDEVGLTIQGSHDSSVEDMRRCRNCTKAFQTDGSMAILQMCEYLIEPISWSSTAIGCARKSRIMWYPSKLA